MPGFQDRGWASVLGDPLVRRVPWVLIDWRAARHFAAEGLPRTAVLELEKTFREVDSDGELDWLPPEQTSQCFPSPHLRTFCHVFEDHRERLPAAARALKAWQRLGQVGEGKPLPKEAVACIALEFFSSML